ncbi:helix-turn-helix transcriptional regulator [Geobacillus thermodenitrificans]|jgi:HTH-type transcriptional regulator, competence development regulator|nr:helix-turn-helix transcriptional regulator [Parageobacillus toebii]NNU92428.1 XRE family transcriptional regulator [Geobacillus sp. NFOSA3]WMT19852.1 helix-turn-helix transcriptional regulator [Parageobacillus toebii]
MYNKEFGDYLRSLRKRKNLSIKELQELSGVSDAYISQIENGKKPIPSPKTLEKLYKHLDVSFEQLLEKAGYIPTIKQHTSVDLYDILQKPSITYKGFPLSPKQRELLKDLLNEFISNHNSTQ